MYNEFTTLECKGERKTMKKWFRTTISILLSLVIMLAVCACDNNSSEHNNSADGGNQQKKSPDLTGSWVQKGKEDAETYQAGYIKDGVIEIFWITDNGDTHMLYWSGTYDAPTEEVDEYKWDSSNNRIKTDTAILASDDNTKTFSYKNGEISYEASAFGITTTITLIPSEEDYTSFADAGGTSGAAQEGQQIELVKSGYHVYKDDSRNYVYYAVQIHNPNTDYVVEFPKIQITAKSADNKILKTEEQVLGAIAADDTIIYGSYISYEGDAAQTVEITVSNDEYSYMHQKGSEVIKQNELTVTNVSENIGSYSKTYTGEVTNTSTVDLDSTCITVIFKKGDDIVGGEITFVHDLKSRATEPFEISSYTEFHEYDSYEIHALQW